MNILFFIGSMGAGGAERTATTLCNSWAIKGHSVCIVATYSGGGLPFFALNPLVEIQYLADLVGSQKKTAFTYVKRLFTLRELVTKTKADVVISFLPNVNIAAILATAFKGVPVIISERRDPSSQPISRFWEFVCRLLYRFADVVVVQTKNARSNIIRLYPDLRKVVCVPNPIPMELLSLRHQLDRGSRKILLSLGRLVPEKQVSHIIRCFSRLSNEFHNWDLHIYGDGSERQNLEKLACHLNMSSRIFFGGYAADPWSVMRAVDGFVMTSRFEGFPNSLLESMAMGIPCISYDCQSGPYDISLGGKDALLVEKDNEEDLYIKLFKLISDPEFRHEMGARGRASVLQRFDIVIVLELWDNLFSELGLRP